MKSNYKRLGDYIRQIDERNIEDKRFELLGVSVEKRFIKSIANTVGTDWRGYKKIRRGQFCYISDTSRRGDKIGVALLKEQNIALVSQAYTVFEIVKLNDLLPEYLELWYKRTEFDRYARYHSHGSVREIFDWDAMCDVMLPIPSLAEQQKIVAAYNVIENRIALKRKINDNLESLFETLFKKLLLCSGEGYTDEPLDKNIKFINGLAMQNFRPTDLTASMPVIKIRELNQGFCDDKSEYCATTISKDNTVFKGDLVFSWSGSLMADIWQDNTAGLNQHLFKVTSSVYPLWFCFLWVRYYLIEFQRIAENKGTTFGHIKREDLSNAEINVPPPAALQKLDGIITPLFKQRNENTAEILRLRNAQGVQLTQLSSYR